MLRSTPVYSVFGNHERFVAQDLTQTGDYFNMFTFPTNAEAGGVASGTEAYYSFDFRNVHFVVLDSEDYASSPAALTPWSRGSRPISLPPARIGSSRSGTARRTRAACSTTRTPR